MNKLSSIICNVCRRVITTTPTIEQLKEKNHTCHRLSCYEVDLSIRESELEKAKEYLNSDYYWQRKKELNNGKAG